MLRLSVSKAAELISCPKVLTSQVQSTVLFTKTIFSSTRIILIPSTKFETLEIWD